MKSITHTAAALLTLAGTSSTRSVSFDTNNDVWSPLFSRQETSPSSWPYGPFSTQGRDIINAKSEPVTWVGVNWPGSGETMVPEGIEFSSIGDILDLVKSVGFNFIRLTYAIEMVDQIYERQGSDVGLEIAMIKGLGYENGTKVTREILERHPGWTKDTTRFEIWDAIAEAAAERQIYVHPDVHVGKAQWYVCLMTKLELRWLDADFGLLGAVIILMAMLGSMTTIFQSRTGTVAFNIPRSGPRSIRMLSVCPYAMSFVDRST